MVIPKVPEKYRKAKREALESWFIGTATIFNEVEIVDRKTHLSEFKKMTVCINEPCRINYQSSNTTTDNEPATLQKSINLRLKPELNIPAGSTFIIEQCGFKAEYIQSGEPRHYIDHQIIPIIQKEYA